MLRETYVSLRFRYVDLRYVKADRPEIEPATCKSQVQRRTAKQPRNMSARRYIASACCFLVMKRPGEIDCRSKSVIEFERRWTGDQYQTSERGPTGGAERVKKPLSPHPIDRRT